MMPPPSRLLVIVDSALLPSSAEDPDIMAMPIQQAINTIDELMALPEDGLRHELLDGVHVVTPTPRPLHQRAAMELFLELRRALADRTDLEVFGVPGDLKLAERTVVEPDVFIIKRPPVTVRSWLDVGIPLLAVEILSPSTAARDRGVKRRLYQQAGVAEYWMVGLDARLIERWRPADSRPEIVDGPLRWSLPDGAGGEIDLPELFHRVLDA